MNKINKLQPNAKKLGHSQCLNALPFLGVGIGLRQEIKELILQHTNKIDFVELMTEHYIDMPPHKINEAREFARKIPLVLHGVELSIGTFGHLDRGHLQKMQQVADLAKAYWVSDHLCFTRVDGLAVGNLTPVPFSKVNCTNIISNVKQAAEYFDCPFLLENISYYFQPSPCEMSEAEFITEILEGSDCYLLLDLTNVQNNAINMSYDPYKFLDSIPLERVVQIHLAGGYYLGSILLDTHSHAVPADVFNLLSYAAPKMPNLRGVLIERDQNYPPFGDLLDELDHVREVLSKYWLPYHTSVNIDGLRWIKKHKRCDYV